MTLICKSVLHSFSAHNYTMPYSVAGAGTQGVILGSSVSLNTTPRPTSTFQVHMTSRALYLIWMRNGLGCEFCLLSPHLSFDRIKIQNVSELENGKNVAYFSLELGRCFNAEERVREEPKVPPPRTSPASWGPQRDQTVTQGMGCKRAQSRLGQVRFFF